MTEAFGPGLAFILAAGIVNASFPLPLKYARHWKWENTWLVFATLALLVFPWALAFAMVPNLGRVYASLAGSALVPGLLFGFLWGLAQVTFGISFAMVGMAMAFAIVVGMCAVLGSFIPLAVLRPSDLGGPRGMALLASSLILSAGLVLYARAARERERDAQPGGSPAAGASNFRKGLAVCLFTGALGGMINLGFAFSGDLSARAVELGATPLSATFAVWAVVLAGGYIPNLVYSVYLLARNGTSPCFGRSTARESALAVAMAALWFGGTYGYGLGAATMGRYGTSIGYAIYVIVLMLWSTTLGVMTGEWKTARPATFRRMRAGVAVILAAVLVLSASGLVQ